MNLPTFIPLELHWLWTATWQAAVLAGLILTLQWLSRNRLSPSSRFVLWWLVLIRLALPVTPSAPWSVCNLISRPMPAPRVQPLQPEIRVFRFAANALSEKFRHVEVSSSAAHSGPTGEIEPRLGVVLPPYVDPHAAGPPLQGTRGTDGAGLPDHLRRQPGAPDRQPHPTLT